MQECFGLPEILVGLVGITEIDCIPVSPMNTSVPESFPIGFSRSLYYCPDLGEHISAGLQGECSAMLLQDHGEPLVLQAIHGQIIARRYIYVDSNGVIRTTGLLVRKKAYINLRLLPGYWFGNT